MARQEVADTSTCLRYRERFELTISSFLKPLYGMQVAITAQVVLVAVRLFLGGCTIGA
jgi:hypothetical protein